MPVTDLSTIQRVLESALEKSRRNREGAPASYIPDLANVPLERTSGAVVMRSGEVLSAGDAGDHEFTLQSSAKLLTLIGLLEERGPVEVFDIVGSEPSGDSFGSVARLETHGPKPANPLINSGAIALCGQLHGTVERRIAWIRNWAERLYGRPIPIDERVQRVGQLLGGHGHARQERRERSDRRGGAGHRGHCGVEPALERQRRQRARSFDLARAGASVGLALRAFR
jgi:glutaminase